MTLLHGPYHGVIDAPKSGPGDVYPLFPATGDEFAELTGMTLDALYLLDETSGNVLDRIGTAHLIELPTPGFRYNLAGRPGILTGASTGHRQSGINLPGTSSAVYGGVWAMKSLAASTIVMGLANGAVAPCMVIGSASDGAIVFRVNDGVSTAQVFNYSAVHVLGTDCPIFTLIQVDRVDEVMRGLVATRTGVYSLSEASIAGYATLDLVGQTWGIGPRGWTGGNANSYAFSRVGADAAGADVLPAIARGLRWV